MAIDSSVPQDQFREKVVEALKNFNQKSWLGENSVLAQPYFLGEYLDKVAQPKSNEGRGEALQMALYDAAIEMWQDSLPTSKTDLEKYVEDERSLTGNSGKRFYFYLLELRYFRRYYFNNRGPTGSFAIQKFLTISGSQYFLRLSEARNMFIDILLNKLRPSIKLETPQDNNHFLGRGNLISECVANLQQKRSITLSGISGIGKSALGFQIARRWSIENTFWYTFHIGLNDTVENFVFSLAFFLHQFDYSSLWYQLNVEKGKLEDFEVVFGLLRHEIQGAKNNFLICLDETEILDPALSLYENEHIQLIDLIGQLSAILPCMLIGQKIICRTDENYILPSLEKKHIEGLVNFFVEKNQFEQQIDVEKVFQRTSGNPRLVSLLLSRILQTGDVDVDLRRSVTLQSLFIRLWKSLSFDERNFLSRLSVYRTAAPVDNWQENNAFSNLEKLNLFRTDSDNGLYILETYRQIIVDQLLESEIVENHRLAGKVRSERGEFSKAAFHFWEAGEESLAIQVWSTYLDHEINEGRANVGREIFFKEPKSELDIASLKQLTRIRNRLNLLIGDNQEVIRQTSPSRFDSQDDVVAELYEQIAQASYRIGDIDNTLLNIERANLIYSEIIQKLIRNQVQIGKMHTDSGNWANVENAYLKGKFELEQLSGVSAKMSGDFIAAISHFKECLNIGEKLDDNSLVARASERLADAVGINGDPALAISLAEPALIYYSEIGDRVSEEGLRGELGSMYLNVGEFDKVVEPVRRALSFFEKLSPAYDRRVAQFSSDLAEAYLETGEPELAEKFAQTAIQTEHPRYFPYASYTLGQIRFQSRQIEFMGQIFESGVNVAKQNGDLFIAGYLYRVWGHMLCKWGEENGQDVLEIFPKGFELQRKAIKCFQQINSQQQVNQTINLTNQLVARLLHLTAYSF